MKNKIGIITFHASHNCGSMLQAYALQFVLKNKFNKNVEIINFSNKGQQNLYSCLPKADTLRRFIKNVIYFTNIYQILRCRKEYQKFYQYFSLSEKFYQYTNELCEVDNIYEKIITGSDQVWNIKCCDADIAYFLSFSKKPKYAYAISFGANNVFDYSNNRRNQYIEYCKDFVSISVRENNAKKWVDDALGIKSQICLDPTLLMTKNEWEQQFDLSKRLIEHDYIFCYTFGLNSKVNKFLKYISKKYKLPVYIIDPKEYVLRFCWKDKIKLAKHYGPISFLNLMKHAHFIITTSFHGTVFSTIFEKTFWYIDNEKNSLDDRATTLLSQLHLMNRYKSIDYLMKIDLLTPINYNKSKEAINQLKKDSFSFLNGIVNG